MITRIRNWLKHMKITIQVKLIATFLCTTLVVFGMNTYMYMNINRMIESIDAVYASNVTLNQLQTTLKQLQSNMTEYLKTKSSDSMENYFRCEQDYKNQIQKLNGEVLNDETLIMEKNIRNLSENYLLLAAQTVEAKRGRDVYTYTTSYEEASKLYEYIDTFIYSLNNQCFQTNSNNYDILVASLKHSETVNVILMCAIAALTTLLIVMLTQNITRPLKQLSEAANRVAEGNLDIPMPVVVSNDEVGVVTKTFQQMLVSLKSYIERLKESMEMESALKEKELMMETHLKDAQLKYLQAQINPHFLFNTLNAGAQLAMLEDAERTYRYIQNVADFFRYNVRKNHESVTLQEELQLVDTYIYILNVRFAGEIDFHTDIDARLTDVRIPSMILQPIVENSVNHGIRNIDRRGRIELSVRKENDMICITVSDNGIGMSEETIQSILHSQLREPGPGSDSNGIGLDNVIGRLKLFYGREDVIEITSAGENQGTQITVFIPIEKE